ncbi:MAG TPA: phosphatidate cytidylyltransferase [Propionibacteriaceae bacterium]|nr:phosphatidate cytidylyltransferase [Propionibacteriaceae bacterium]
MDDAREAVDRVNARAGRNLPAAIGVGLLLIAWLVLSLLYFVPGFVVLVVVCIVFSSIELHRALEMAGRGRSSIVPVALGGAVTAVGAYLAAGRGAEDALFLVVTPMALTSAVALGWRLRKGPVDYVKDASASLFAIAYVTLLGAFLPLAVGERHGALRIAAMILCVVASDVGGYVAGVTIGKHKLAPVISPKKTWEGVGGSVLLALVVGWVTVDVLLGGPLWAGLLFGVAMVVVGTVGDLVESMVKRDLGIKDMSSFLPGHGGFLDRIDSIVYAAPVGWLLLHVLVPHA